MKITPNHLERGAFIYIRQSTADQLANSQRLRAGWPPVPGRVYPGSLKQKYWRKSRQDWLQLRRNLHCL